MWLDIALELAEPINVVMFDLEFTSDPAAEGLLALYVDEIPVGTVDERYVLGGPQRYTFGLGTVDPGFHTLAFRLDAFTNTQSSVVVSNVTTGLETIVPEPSAGLLLLLGLFSILAYRRLHR